LDAIELMIFISSGVQGTLVRPVLVLAGLFHGRSRNLNGFRSFIGFNTDAKNVEADILDDAFHPISGCES
jgi:hypothetical protein